MTTIKNIKGAWLVGLLPALLTVGGGWLFASCSDDAEEAPVPAVGREMDIAVAASIRAMDDPSSDGATRSWSWDIPTTSYTTFYHYDELYGGGSIANFENLSKKTIDVFFTKDKNADYHGRLHYNTTSGWKLALNDGTDPESIEAGDYYVYGFIPRSAADGATIALRNPSDPSCTFADGAVLTIQGLPSVMSDACVIVGAREGFMTKVGEDSTYYDGGYTDSNSNTDYDEGIDPRTNRLQAGDFKFNFQKDGSGNLKNCLFLLFDHLCAALNVTIKVHGEYDALRTIKLKNIHLKTSNISGITKKSDVTVTLQKTADGSDPIQSITYTPTATESTGDDVFTSADGLTLTTDPQVFLGHFMPEGVSILNLTCTYDVYDKNVTPEHPEGNLVRKDCVVTNNIRLDRLVAYFTSVERGKKYLVNLTIQPTFLYVLSEPDLDNPTMTLSD